MPKAKPVDPRVMEVALALANPGNSLPEWQRSVLLGMSMVPIAEIAVATLDELGALDD